MEEGTGKNEKGRRGRGERPERREGRRARTCGSRGFCQGKPPTGVPLSIGKECSRYIH